MIKENKCPKCESSKIAGLMAAFWVALDSNGNPKDLWQNFCSETELTGERNCGECGHEWEEE